MPFKMHDNAVVSKVYMNGHKHSTSFTVYGKWTCEEFFKQLRTKCKFSQNGQLTIKWLDDEDDPCTDNVLQNKK